MAGLKRGVTGAIDSDGDGIPDIDETFDYVIVCNNDSRFREKREELKPQDGFPADEIPPTDPMVRHLKTKLAQMHLRIHGFPSATWDLYYIQITADEDILLYWAEQMELPMRLTTRASIAADKMLGLRLMPEEERPADYEAQMEKLEKERADASTARQYAEFGGMVPFRAEKKKEFRPSRNKHFQQSMFCSGERQRIIKYLIENEHDGLDLNESKLKKPKKDGLMASFNPLNMRRDDDDDEDLDDIGIMIEAIIEEEKHSVGQLAVQSNNDVDAQEAWNEDDRRAELQTLGVDEVRKQCRMWVMIKDYFPLHDQFELEFLIDTWAKRNVLGEVTQNFDWQTLGVSGLIDSLTEQPIDEIRDYYGEQIALYFAFIQTYTRSLIWPTMLGIITMVGHFQNGVEGNQLTVVYSILVSFWSVYFLSKWKRRQAELMFLWGTQNYEASETPRDEFIRFARDPSKDGVVFKKSDITGKMEAVETTPWMKYVRISGSVAVILFFMGLVYLTVMFAMWVKLDSDTKYASQIGSLISASSIVIFAKVYEQVAVYLTDMENHRTQTQYEDAQITKSFLFQAFNNFFVLFFIAFLKQGTIDTVGFIEVDARNSTCILKEIDCNAEELHIEVADHCIDGKLQVPSCMSELQTQLLIVFCLKQVLLGSLEIIIPLVKAKTRAAVKQTQMESLKKEKGNDLNDLHASSVGEEHRLEPYGTVFGDYNELAIQFGYSTLFAVALPLAPLLAMINNCAEMRTDAYKLCKVHRRPEFATRQDIGSWQTVYETIAIMAVMNNAMLTGFVGSQTAVWLGEDRYEEMSSERRMLDPYLWMVAVLIEHCILGLRFAVFSVVPDQPSWIAKAKLQIEHTLDDRLMTDNEKKLKKQEVRNTFAHLNLGCCCNVASGSLGGVTDFVLRICYIVALEFTACQVQKEKDDRAQNEPDSCKCRNRARL